MLNRDKITELLLKDHLTEEEKSLLKGLINSDKEAEEFVNFYQKTKSAVSTSSHLSYEEIGDYILYKNNLAPEDPAIIKSIPKIENHLRECSNCSEEFKKLNSEYADIESFVASELNTGEKKSEPAVIVSRKNKFSFSRYTFISVIIIGIIYSALFAFSKISAPKYYDLASVQNQSDFYATRGRATDDFIKGLNALDNGKIGNAIDYLKSDIKNNPDDKTIFYSYYILGLTYLDNAETKVIGLFPGFNSSYAEQALLNLKEAIRKNNSGNYMNINYDAYFYSAKASLILGNINEAKKDLEIVIKNRGSKLDEAEDILKKLQ
jgi:hypothetical protein